MRPEWPDNEIALYGPDTDSGTFDYFTVVIVGEEGVSRPDYPRPKLGRVLALRSRRCRHPMPPPAKA